jgi:hypothetical protein
VTALKSAFTACSLVALLGTAGLRDAAQARGGEAEAAIVNQYAPPHNAVSDQQYWIQYLPTIKKERVLQFPDAASLVQGVVDVSLDRSDATDSGAKYLASMPNIQHITAVRGTLEGACLKDWATLKNLHSMRLDNCPLARPNFRYFADMPALQFLSLERCFIKDGEMKYLGNCKHLIALTLCDNFYINDINISYLKNCHTLRFLNVTNTSVTAVGLMKLAGIKFQIIYAPDAKCTPVQKEALNKAFPGTYFAFTRILQNKEVNRDDKVLFAPLH